MASSYQGQRVKDWTLFACFSCRAIWTDPVTIKCGHTFCRECLQKDFSRKCHCCGELFDGKHEPRTNVLLSALVEKCFPDVVQIARLKSKSKKLLLDGKFSEASGNLTEAVEKAPTDCGLRNSRAETYVATGHFREALEDAERMIQLQPDLPEVAERSTSEDVDDESPSSLGNRKQSLQEMLTTEDFECTLCLRLLLYPITTQCGHVFCRDCIYRSLDYRSVCPLCKESLAEFLAERREATTNAVEKIIERFFAKELEIRGTLQNEDAMLLPRALSDNRQEIPIFVCTVAYPCVPCPLRIFEPRYRLMMRRCMETGTRQFGMCTCLESREENFYEYGTILEIRGIQYLPDGQSYVDCVGGRRFRVINRGIRDGYRTAEVEYLRDETPALEQMDALQQLQTDVHAQAVQWFASIPAIARASIVHSFGDIPAPTPAEAIRQLADGPAWIWFMVAILPVDQRAQLSLLSMTSLRNRLVGLHRVLQYFQRRGHSS